MCNLVQNPTCIWIIVRCTLKWSLSIICIQDSKMHNASLIEAAPLGARLGDAVAEEHDIGLQHAAAHATGRYHEVARCSGNLHVAVWSSRWRLCK